jgi:hypothetical protein
LEQRATLSAKSDTTKAINYGLSRWEAFTRFVDDGRICLTNAAAEPALRGIALGRKNWTFAGSDAGGQRAAAFYTLIETCKLNDIDPQYPFGLGRLARKFLGCDAARISTSLRALEAAIHEPSNNPPRSRAP